MTTIAATIIQPTFVPFAMVALLFLGVLPIEWITMCLYQRHMWAGVGRLVGLVTAANVISTLVGAGLGFLVSPSPFITKHAGGIGLVMASFLVAFLLSWVIEYLFLNLFRKKMQFRRLAPAVGMANLISYAGLMIVALFQL